MKTAKWLFFCTVILAVLTPFIPLMLWATSGRYHYPSVIPDQFSLRAYEYIFTTGTNQITGGILMSFLLATVTSATAVIIGLPAGRAMGLYRFKGKSLIAILLTLPVIVPPLSVAMGLHLWFIHLHLAETFIGVVLVHLTFCLPYAIYVIWGVFSDYNPEIEEQARSLGASPIQILLHTTVPLILPGITVAAIFCFLVSWSQYLSTLIIGGGKVLTLPILLFSLMDSGDRPVAAAVSLLFILPPFLTLIAGANWLGRSGLRGIR